MRGSAFSRYKTLRHLPRRSSKNGNLQFAKNDRFKENYSIDNNMKIISENNILYIDMTRYYRVLRENPNLSIKIC